MKTLKIFHQLTTPHKIQDYLDRLDFNFDDKKKAYRSPVEVVKTKKAHCFEGALFAAACLYMNGKQPLILDLKVKNLKKDADHTVALFKINDLWGAISKVEHSVLRWRDPVYKTVRELVMSYFHEYYMRDGEKNLISYSLPFDIVKKFGTDWITANESLDEIAEKLDESKHFPVFPEGQKKYLRRASKLEIRASNMVE